MNPTNAAIADTLRRYAAVLAIHGADRFKLKAYRRAAETIEALHESISELIRRGSDLTELPGIGKAINQVIDEVVRTGRLARLEKTLAELPTEQAELAVYPRLDAKNCNADSSSTVSPGTWHLIPTGLCSNRTARNTQAARYDPA